MINQFSINFQTQWMALAFAAAVGGEALAQSPEQTSSAPSRVVLPIAPNKLQVASETAHQIVEVMVELLNQPEMQKEIEKMQELYTPIEKIEKITAALIDACDRQEKVRSLLNYESLRTGAAIVAAQVAYLPDKFPNFNYFVVDSMQGRFKVVAPYLRQLDPMPQLDSETVELEMQPVDNNQVFLRRTVVDKPYYGTHCQVRCERKNTAKFAVIGLAFDTIVN